jgi:Flp pilus assembly protein TadB
MVLLRVAPSHWLRTPVKDLAILGRTATSYYGEKLTLVGIAVIAAPMLSLVAVWLFELPLVVPVGVTIAGVVGAWLLVGQSVKSRAEEARADFTLALTTYVELVALDRRAGGSGTRQAMEAAAAQGASWPFRRISEALTQSRLGQVPPWDGLHDLGEELAVPALTDLADTMRLAGLEGAQVFDALQAQSAALRHAMLTQERTRANRVSERTVIPTVFMGLIFAATIIAPGLMRMFAG